MKFRKIIITALTAAMIMSLSGCKDESSTYDISENVTTTEATTEATEEKKETETTEAEDTSSDNSQKDEIESTEESETQEDEPAQDGTPAGDGLVSEEELQKGWAWLKSFGFKMYEVSYEEVEEYFGVDGYLRTDEYSENIHRNRRVYKWISKDDETHYITVNLEERDAEGAPGVFTISGFSANGFDYVEAEEKYKDEVK